MRDLYSRLGIDTSATPQRIRRAIFSCKDESLKKNASEVLLNESRKKSYDQVHATLTDIGILRVSLGLNQSEHWQGSESEDFKGHKRPQPSTSRTSDKKIMRHDTKVTQNRFFKAISDNLSDVVVIVMVVLIAVFAYEASTNSDPTPKSTSQANGTDQQAIPVFKEPAFALPETGAVQRYTDKSNEAPLQIKTSSGSNYLVRLEDISSGKNIMEVFVRGGTTVDIEVPLGTYQLKYASGQTWYGPDHLFGPETAYNKADTPFQFYIEDQRISGYTVTLYRVSDGNLTTSKLLPAQF
jgi:hypothetical protein